MKNGLLLLWLFFSIIFLFQNDSVSAGELRAGTAIVDITAPVGYPMGGYGARKDVSTGIHDPLYARVLLLKTKNISLALVTCDLVFFFSPRIAQEAKSRWGVDYVILSTSHTHSGPFPKLQSERDIARIFEDPWYRSTEDKIIAAIGESRKNIFTANVAAGKGSILLGHNRRLIGKDGKVTMLWRNEDHLPTSPVDPTAGVIRIDDETGIPRAILVNYACHAVVMGPDNLQFSADYPGYMTHYVQNKFGDDCLCYFLQGAAGDINPYHDKEPLTKKGFKAAEETGTALGEEVVRVAKQIKTEPNSDASIKVKIDTLTFAYRYDASKTMQLGIVTVVINNTLAFVGIPGEPFVEFQINLAAQSLLSNTFLLGCTSVGVGTPFAAYLPTIKAAAEGGYGASYATMVEVGAGERIITKALVNIYTMLGRLKNVPIDVVTK